MLQSGVRCTHTHTPHVCMHIIQAVVEGGTATSVESLWIGIVVWIRFCDIYRHMCEHTFCGCMSHSSMDMPACVAIPRVVPLSSVKFCCCRAPAAAGDSRRFGMAGEKEASPLPSRPCSITFSVLLLTRLLSSSLTLSPFPALPGTRRRSALKRWQRRRGRNRHRRC